jgi:hypothetical protein
MRPYVRVSGPVAPLALLLAAVVGWLSTITAQQPERAGRQIISDLTGPGIDRGLRANDPPRLRGSGGGGSRPAAAANIFPTASSSASGRAPRPHCSRP